MNFYSHSKISKLKRFFQNEPVFFPAIHPMTQWGGILGPLPPRDSLTGDTNLHTHTLSPGVCNRTCSLQVQNLSTVNLFVHYFFLPLHYIHTYPLSNKHIHSCHCSSCWFCFFYCWCFSLCAHSFLISIFPLFSVTHICTLQVLQSCAWFIKLLTDSVLPLVLHIPVSLKSVVTDPPPSSSNTSLFM